VGGVAVVRVVRVERDDHPRGARVRAAPAPERLVPVLRDAERVRLVTVAVIDVPLEMGVHRLQGAGGGPPVPAPPPRPSVAHARARPRPPPGPPWAPSASTPRPEWWPATTWPPGGG